MTTDLTRAGGAGPRDPLRAVRYGVLGDLTVSAGDADRTPRGQRSRDLLAALLLRPDRAVGADVLLDLVWGDDAALLDASVVHTQVARLRRAVGPDQVLTAPTGYRLAAPSTDALDFHALVADARLADDPGLAVDLLDRARGLWRGPRAFADVSDALVAGECARLADARLAADELLVELLLSSASRDDVVRALGLARELVELEPLRERTSELAMLAAARLDEQGEALAVYDALRHRLREELGVDPGRSVQLLHARVLDQDVDLLGPRVVGRGPALAVAPAPVPATRLVGRERDLAALLELVERRRVVVVTGPGGVGKTRLALEAVDVLAGEREVCFVDLAATQPTSESEVVDEVASCLALQIGSDAGPAAVAAALGERTVLLVVDEAEHHLAGVAAVVAEVARRCPGVTTLVTSRSALGVVGEAVMQLGPLELPARRASRRSAAEAPAVRLLLERLRDHTPALVIGPPEIDQLSGFARQLDGLPLALELVAGYAGSRSIGDLAELLDTPLDLAAADVGRGPRHRSLRDTLAWTTERLSPEHGKVLRRLGVFAGSFDFSGARHVVGDDCGTPEEIDEAVRALARESLLQVERIGHSLRLRMLRTVRDLALEAMADHDDLPALRARHRTWFAAPRDVVSDLAVVDHVRHHHDDYLAALRSAVASADGPSAVALLLRLGRWWESMEMAAPARWWTDRVLAEVPLGASDTARVQALRGSLILDIEPEAGREDLLAALPALRLDHDGEAVVLAEVGLAIERAMSGVGAEAIGHAEGAVAAARRWQPGRIRLALSVLAAVSVDLQPELAETAAAEALEMLLGNDVGDDRPAVATNIAWTLLALGHASDAVDVVDAVAGSLDPEAVPAFLRGLQGWSRLLLGEPDAALACFAGGLAGEGPELDARWHADSLTGAACALAALRHPDAHELMDGAENLADRTGYVLSPWQRAAVAVARSSLTAVAAPWAAGRVRADRRLLDIVAARGAGRATSPGGGSGSVPDPDVTGT